jgi:hypothetical protein
MWQYEFLSKSKKAKSSKNEKKANFIQENSNLEFHNKKLQVLL